MSDDSAELDRIRAVKAKYEKKLLRKRNVVGVGIGLRQKDGEPTGQMVLTVMVQQEQPPSRLWPWDRIPSELDGVPVDIQSVGTIKAL
jgi:hypothetical protein